MSLLPMRRLVVRKGEGKAADLLGGSKQLHDTRGFGRRLRRGAARLRGAVLRCRKRDLVARAICGRQRITSRDGQRLRDHGLSKLPAEPGKTQGTVCGGLRLRQF